MQFIRMVYTSVFNSAFFLEPLFCCLKVFDGVKVDTYSGLQGFCCTSLLLIEITDNTSEDWKLFGEFAAERLEVSRITCLYSIAG